MDIKRILDQLTELSNGISWADLGESLSPEEKLSIIENHYSDNSLSESNEPDASGYFQGLSDYGVDPVVSEKYIVAPLSLINNRLVMIDKPAVMTFVGQTPKAVKFQSADGQREYPLRSPTPGSVFKVFTFTDTTAYNQFRSAVSMRFDLSLPEVHDELSEGQALARPKMPGAGMTPATPKDIAKKTKKLDLFKSLDEELKETAVLRRISQKFEDFKQSLDEYGGYSGTTGTTTQPQTNGTTDDKQAAAELQQTQKTLQTLKPQLQKAGAQNIDVNRMTQALAQVDDNPAQQTTGQTAQQLNKLAPGIADALKNPQSAQMLKTAIEKGEQAAQQQAQAQKRT